MIVQRRDVRIVSGGAMLSLAGGFVTADMAGGVVALVVGVLLGGVATALAFWSAARADQRWWGVAMILVPLLAVGVYAVFGMRADDPAETSKARREQVGTRTPQQRRREALIALAIAMPFSLIAMGVVFVATESAVAVQATALLLGAIGGTIYALWLRRARGATARWDRS